MTIGVIASLLAAGLTVLLARETRLRRALEALCARLVQRMRHQARRHRIRPARPPRFTAPRR
jgi:hypothetical protein